MSLWTPGGEHPVDREPSEGQGTGSSEPVSADRAQMSADQEAEAHQLAAEMQQVRDQLAQVPAAMVVANHAMGCYELAAIPLSNQPPKLDEAQLAIDAFAALLGVTDGRLGPDEATWQDALAQIRLALVQVKASWEQATAADGATTGVDASEPGNADDADD